MSSTEVIIERFQALYHTNAMDAIKHISVLCILRISALLTNKHTNIKEAL